MALLSLSVKRHLGEEFPIAPPSPPQSPIFCSSPIRLLSSLHTSSLTSLPENHVKKRRKQEHPLFLTDSLYAVNESSVDGLEKFHSSEDRVKEELAALSSDIPELSKVDASGDVDVAEMQREWTGVDRFGTEVDVGPSLENKERETLSSQSFDEEKPGNQSASESTVPLLLLSQVASDAMGQLSPLKLQPDIITSLKQEEEFPSKHPPPSEDELPEGDPVTEDGPAEVCPDCKKVFKRKIYLQRHIAREHWSLAKIFKCEKCAYETKHQSNLLVHRRTHTGERPYHCGACGQRYTQGHLLKAHIRSRHGADMRFYNMDKRTDGMRCRRLLGAKLLGGGKEDRIRFLLQAAEAARQHPSPPPPRPVFGGMIPPGLNQYMNVLSCLPNGMRPMLWPSLLSAASGSLLGSSGFQSTPLQNGMPSHAALLSSLAAPLSLTGGKMSQTNDIGSKVTGGSILSSMLALPSSTMSFQAIKTEKFPDDQFSKGIASSPERSDCTQKSFCAPVTSLDFPTMPEDLTTTRRSAANRQSFNSPVRDRMLPAQSLGFVQYSLSPLSHATSLSLSRGGDCENILATDLSIRDNAKIQDSVANQSSNDSKVLFPSSSSTMCFVDQNDDSGFRGVNPSEVASLPPDDQKVLLNWNNARLASFLTRSELFPSSSQSSYLSFVKPPPYRGHSDSAPGELPSATKSPSHADADQETIIQNSPCQDGLDQAAGETKQSKPDEAKPLSQCHSTCTESGSQCKESCCPYLKKLKDLRRNVYRMLCVFTPYLGVADINDYEADSIDEFLHEVIYSKLDDTD